MQKATCLPVHRGWGFQMAGGGSTRSAASVSPGRAGEQQAYTSCMNSARGRKVSCLVSFTPATTWSCRSTCGSLSTIPFATLANPDCCLTCSGFERRLSSRRSEHTRYAQTDCDNPDDWLRGLSVLHGALKSRCAAEQE